LNVLAYSKKLPPPTPDGCEGRLFPPEQSWKTLRLLNEPSSRWQQIFFEKFLVASTAVAARQRQEINHVGNQKTKPEQRDVWRRERAGEMGCTSARRGF
jgi:hypothetical protein